MHQKRKSQECSTINVVPEVRSPRARRTRTDRPAPARCAAPPPTDRRREDASSLDPSPPPIIARWSSPPGQLGSQTLSLQGSTARASLGSARRAFMSQSQGPSTRGTRATATSSATSPGTPPRHGSSGDDGDGDGRLSSRDVPGDDEPTSPTSRDGDVSFGIVPGVRERAAFGGSTGAGGGSGGERAVDAHGGQSDGVSAEDASAELGVEVEGARARLGVEPPLQADRVDVDAHAGGQGEAEDLGRAPAHGRALEGAHVEDEVDRARARGIRRADDAERRRAGGVVVEVRPRGDAEGGARRGHRRQGDAPPRRRVPPGGRGRGRGERRGGAREGKVLLPPRGRPPGRGARGEAPGRGAGRAANAGGRGARARCRRGHGARHRTPARRGGGMAGEEEAPSVTWKRRWHVSGKLTRQ